MKKYLLPGVLLTVGMLVALGGAAMVYLPAAVIAAGLSLVGVALLVDW